LTSITLLMSAGTPVTPIRWPNALPSAARTPARNSTPGRWRSAFSEAVDVGAKPFCDVSA
jgi:hypothetical protein